MAVGGDLDSVTMPVGLSDDERETESVCVSDGLRDADDSPLHDDDTCAVTLSETDGEPLERDMEFDMLELDDRDAVASSLAVGPLPLRVAVDESDDVRDSDSDRTLESDTELDSESVSVSLDELSSDSESVADADRDADTSAVGDPEANGIVSE